MADPIGAISLAITLIQGAYKAYGIHKLTEAFGNDFRRLQRRFDAQIGLLRIQAYRLRQATLLGLVSRARLNCAKSNLSRRVHRQMRKNGCRTSTASS
jgi:hypothetical protein